MVLVDDLGAAQARAEVLGLDVPLRQRRSRAGLWTYWRCGVLICTHGLYGTRRRRRGRRIVGLWHGEFGKLLGAFLGEPRSHYDWMPVSSSLSRAWRSAEFLVPPPSVHVVGTPRQTMLSDATASRVLQVIGPGPHVVWAPTYRVTGVGRPHVDGEPGVVQRDIAPDDPQLRSLLSTTGATLWMRPHPSDAETESLARRLADSGVRSASNADLAKLGLTFYELLSAANCLVTDYSSLWVDFLVCDRPMVSYCPDLAAFRETRGLALEPHEYWFPGPVVEDAQGFLSSVEGALLGTDRDREHRGLVRRLLHTSLDADPVKAVWAFATARRA